MLRRPTLADRARLLLAVLAMSLGLAWLTPVLAAPAAGATMDEVCSAIMGIDPAAAAASSEGDKATSAHHHNACPVCGAAVSAPPTVVAPLVGTGTDFAAPQCRPELSPQLITARPQARAPPAFAI
jgi:hypothetical protein